jgi:hypothetical protein
MTVFIRPEFTPDTLLTFNGYHLQIFAAGRAKISLRTLVNNKKHEFYTALPKRDRAAFQRQKARSGATLPEHFAAINQLLSAHPDAKVFRVHAKGDNNATADNAHVVASLDQEARWLVMSGVVHRWELTTLLVHVLLEGKGKRTGEASIFYEYVPTQDHDWQDAEFVMADYAKGFREGPASTAIPTAPTAPSSKAALPPSQMITQPTPKAAPRVQPASVETDYVSDDPYDDPILFADPTCEDAEDIPYANPLPKVPQQVMKKGTSTLYDKGGLWEQVQGTR